MRARLSSRPRTASTSNTPGEVPRPVSAARSGCATSPSFRPLRLRNRGSRLRSAWRSSRPRALQGRLRACQDRAWALAKQRGRLIVDRQRPGREQKSCTFSQFDQCLGAFLEPRHGCAAAGFLRVVETLPRWPAVSRYGRVAQRCRASSASSICRIWMPFSASSFWKSKRAAPRLTSSISNQRIISSSDMTSSSPWLQPRRAR